MIVRIKTSHHDISCLIQGQVIWDLWCTKWHWGGFSLSTSVSPVNCYCTNCSTLINYRIVDAIVSMLTASLNNQLEEDED
jgi:hypothetical protein